MADKQPNIVVFWWDNFGWGELSCYGGGELRGAPTPRIDKFADEGLKLLNFNVEAQCTPSRSAILTGRHAIRSGTQSIPVTGGPDGMTQWEVTIARALSDAGYATGMWGKWHLGSDPENRSPVNFGFDEAVWCPRTADEVLWTMQSYFPKGTVAGLDLGGDVEALARVRHPRIALPTDRWSWPSKFASSKYSFTRHSWRINGRSVLVENAVMISTLVTGVVASCRRCRAGGPSQGCPDYVMSSACS